MRATDVGLTGSESAKDITANAEAITFCKELRGKAAQLIVMCADWELVDEQSPGLPFVILVAPSIYGAADLAARVIFMNRCHDSIAGTAAVGVAACSCIPNSVLSEILGKGAIERNVVQIGHPEGIMPISIKTKAAGQSSDLVEFDMLAFERTSRRIMSGSVFIPKQIWNGDGQTRKEMLPKRTHLLMTGDINLLNVDDSTEPFRKVADSLSAADIVISNLECVLGMPEQAYSIQHEGFFANPIVGAEALHLGKIAAVGLANNINYGARNILGSIATLDKAGIPHTGAGANIEAARKPVIIERGAGSMAFFSALQYTGLQTMLQTRLEQEWRLYLATLRMRLTCTDITQKSHPLIAQGYRRLLLLGQIPSIWPCSQMTSNPYGRKSMYLLLAATGVSEKKC